MRIIFISGNLEPGKCGVGDCTRKLAYHLIKLGHEIRMIALHDVFTQEEYSGTQDMEEMTITVLRLPSIMESSTRFFKAKCWIDEFDPQWLSLQYVPFSFQNKGLPFLLSGKLLKLGRKRNWQVMFHELWLGMEKEANLKMYFWGQLQRFLISSMLRNLNPRIVHTQSQLHQHSLKQMGIKAHLLPLMSSIPVLKTKQACPDSLCQRSISLVLFGSIYGGAPISEFAREAATYMRLHERKVTIMFLGFNRSGVETWSSICKDFGLPVEILGLQPEPEVSSILSNANFGISTTPYLLVEKSSAVIAMREHGLPVLCVARPYHTRKKIALKPIDGILQYIPGNLASCLEKEREGIGINESASKISNRFISSLLSSD